MANTLTIKDINKDLFWELATSGIVADYQVNIVKDYLYMLCEQLKKDLDISFRTDGYNITNEQLGIKIPSIDCTDYDKVLKIIEKFLSENSQENKFGVNTNKLANEWGYSFSEIAITPYYEGNGKWHAYDEYSQPKVFEVMYFGVFGEFHKDLGFAQELGKKYLEQDNWNEKKHFKGSIPELNGLNVTFAKNGNITVKSPSKDFIERVAFWYSIVDPKNKNHVR